MLSRDICRFNISCWMLLGVLQTILTPAALPAASDSRHGNDGRRVEWPHNLVASHDRALMDVAARPTHPACNHPPRQPQLHELAEFFCAAEEGWIGVGLPGAAGGAGAGCSRPMATSQCSRCRHGAQPYTGMNAQHFKYPF